MKIGCLGLFIDILVEECDDLYQKSNYFFSLQNKPGNLCIHVYEFGILFMTPSLLSNFSLPPPD